jgi:hypothetical protein
MSLTASSLTGCVSSSSSSSSSKGAMTNN